MKCIILAAGYATRLYPLTENFPKPLLPVSGKPILDWLIDDLESVGAIDGYVVVSNHKFAGHFEKWAEEKQCRIAVVDDGTSTNETRLGAVKDIQFAVENRHLDEDLLIIAGDNLMDFSFHGFIQFAKEKGTSCVMCHEEHDLEKQRRTAIITVDSENKITSYEEKPKEPKGNLAVPPFYYYRAEDIRRISEALEDGCNADAPGSFAAWLSEKTAMHAWKMPGRRYDIGNRESYDAVQEIFRK